MKDTLSDIIYIIAGLAVLLYAIVFIFGLIRTDGKITKTLADDTKIKNRVVYTLTEEPKDYTKNECLMQILSTDAVVTVCGNELNMSKVVLAKKGNSECISYVKSFLTKTRFTKTITYDEYGYPKSVQFN